MKKQLRNTRCTKVFKKKTVVKNLQGRSSRISFGQYNIDLGFDLDLKDNFKVKSLHLNAMLYFCPSNPRKGIILPSNMALTMTMNS